MIKANESDKSPLTPPAPDPTKRVLFVDDETAILFAYRKLIERWGYRIDVCESLGEAIRLIRTHAYTTVIADLRLTGIETTEGLEILRFVGIERPGTTVIIVTGFGTEETKSAAFALGASYYFEKPILPSKILNALNSLN